VSRAFAERLGLFGLHALDQVKVVAGGLVEGDDGDEVSPVDLVQVVVGEEDAQEWHRFVGDQVKAELVKEGVGH